MAVGLMGTRKLGMWSRLTARFTAFNRGRRRRGLVLPVTLTSPHARLVGILVVTLVGLLGGFFYGQRLLLPVSSGREISLTRLFELSKSCQLVSATLYQYDHRAVGRYNLSLPPPTAQAGAGGSAPGCPTHAAASATDVTFWAGYPQTDAETPLIIERLVAGGAAVSTRDQPEKQVVMFTAQYLLPLLILANLFALIFLGAKGGGGDALGGIVQFGRIGKKRARGTGEHVTTFADVAGADEQVQELREVRDYLKDPARFAAMGAQPPKGVLLFGPPGCGKTLMARAVAGEAGVPFYSISGAEFVESLVGVGAARVRDLFRQVRSVAPAIVFIDELDAAGRRRGGVTGGQEEREQTLNQLLVEMDGFEPTAGIVVMGATNRPDILDPALLRPGRFDRQVTVEPPDLAGRMAILQLHGSGKPLAPEVDFEYLARRTPGFTGADLANVINEAALLSVRFGKSEIGREELEEAVQRVLLGPKRRGHLMTADERRRAAYHETGHALVAAAMGRLDEVQRITIVARGKSLGQATASKSWQERLLLSRAELRNELVVVMSGVASEELILGDTSTGALDDLDRATALAEVMVGAYGMSDRLGKVRLIRSDGSQFLGGDSVPTELTAGPVLMEMHQEVRALIDEAEAVATDILSRHRTLLEQMAERLQAEETMEGRELETMLEPVRPEMNMVAGTPELPHSNGSRMPVAAPAHGEPGT